MPSLAAAFAQRLDPYRAAVRAAGSEDAVRGLALDLARECFGVPLADFEVEPAVFSGRADALLGSLVFEFKRDLRRQGAEAREQLSRYVADLRRDHPGATYTAVASDGLRFECYAPAGDGADPPGLRPLGSLDLERERDAATAFHWLDALLASQGAAPREPTTRAVVAALGPASPAFRAAAMEMGALLAAGRADLPVATKLDQWRRYLSIVYGQPVGDDALFLRHTYLATVAKLAGLLFLEPSLALARDDDMAGALTGSYLARRSIHNYMDEDFFTWFMAAPLRAPGLALVRRLLNTLRAFDFSLAREDILKGLYQELVDPEARHDLGEYYTPDWLAEYILGEVLHLPDDPELSLLDPACGSGTFLFTAVRMARRALGAAGWDPADVLLHLQESVVGVDVHPVAVAIARTNYLLALGDLVRGPHPEFSVPVFLADSVRPPSVTTAEPMGGYEEPVHTLSVEMEGERVDLELPESIVAHPGGMETLANRLPQYLEAAARTGGDPARMETVVEGFRAWLTSPKKASRAAMTEPASGFAAEVLCGTLRKLAALYSQGRDHIWPFVLRNTTRPVFLSRRRFDMVVGNPPWLSLRYVRSPEYARWVRSQVLDEYRLLERSSPHLFTHLEMATLFFARAADLYLHDGGAIAFVMPGAVMVAQQHAGFTGFVFGRPPARGEPDRRLRLSLGRLVDLEGVSPLFNVPACVLAARKGADTTYPVKGTVLSGRLPSRNATWEEAAPLLTASPALFDRVDGRLVPEGTPAPPPGARSYYASRFYQGATIVPRGLWFVQVPDSPFGFDFARPYLETSEEAAATAKPPWREVRMRGSVESHFLYATAPSSSLLPFGLTGLSLVVLPLLREGDRYALVSAERAFQQGYLGLSEWLREAQRHWEEGARRDHLGRLKEPRVVDWLNYRHKLTGQSPAARYRVLYNTSGTNLLGLVLDTHAPGHPVAGPQSVDYRGFLAFHETYACHTDSAAEAHFLAAVLNAPRTDDLIKASQARGLWGPRHISKTVWSLPIPRFDPDDARHRRLAALGEACAARVGAVAAELGARHRGVARRRAAVRQLLREEIAEIDGLVRDLLAGGGGGGPGGPTGPAAGP